MNLTAEGPLTHIRMLRHIIPGAVKTHTHFVLINSVRRIYMKHKNIRFIDLINFQTICNTKLQNCKGLLSYTERLHFYTVHTDS